MKLSESVKSISFLKAHASELIRDVSENQKSLVITLNGEAKAIVLDLASYEKMKDTIALLKMLSHSSKQKKEGRFKPMNQVFKEIKSKIKSFQ